MSNNFNLKNYAELLNKQDLAETDQLQLCCNMRVNSY